jgi:hypothetical protein
MNRWLHTDHTGTRVNDNKSSWFEDAAPGSFISLQQSRARREVSESWERSLEFTLKARPTVGLWPKANSEGASRVSGWRNIW